MSTGWWRYYERQRRACKLTDAQVAKAIHVKASTVSRWKDGTTPQPPALNALATLFGRPVLELFVEAGHLDRAVLASRSPATPEQVEASLTTILDLIARNPDLPERAKEHLTNQVRLLSELADDEPPADDGILRPRRRTVARKRGDGDSKATGA